MSLIERNGSDNGTVISGSLIGLSVCLNGQDVLIEGDFAQIPGAPRYRDLGVGVT